MSETIAQIKKECEEEFKEWIKDLDCDDTHLEDYYGDDSRKFHFYDGYNRAKLKYKKQLKQKDELIRELLDLINRSSWAYSDQEIKEVDLEINHLISRPGIQAIINKERKWAIEV